MFAKGGGARRFFFGFFGFWFLVSAQCVEKRGSKQIVLCARAFFFSFKKCAKKSVVVKTECPAGLGTIGKKQTARARLLDGIGIPIVEIFFACRFFFLH